MIGPADVVIVQRNLLGKEVWDACDYWRGVGKLVVADLDDDYPHLPPQNPAYNFWILDKAELKKRTGYTPIEALTEGFRHVDALVSPNELILQDWSHVVRGYWLPNYAQWKWYKSIKQKPLPGPDEPIVIGWGGSVSHYDGWFFSGLREAIPVITERYPRVKWKICGGDKRVKELVNELSNGRMIDQEGVPPEEWPKQVASFDIGLAPLCGPGSPQSESYDQHRSWLKAVEYALTGVPWIASAGIVYEKLDQQGGFLVENTPDGWTDGIGAMVEKLSQFKRSSKKLMRWARDNLTMEHQVDAYVNVFNQAMGDKMAAIGRRLPNILYAKDFFESVDPVERIEIQPPDTDLLPTLAAQQATNLATVQDWLETIDLWFESVNVGRCLEYPVLHELNNRTYREVVGE